MPLQIDSILGKFWTLGMSMETFMLYPDVCVLTKGNIFYMYAQHIEHFFPFVAVPPDIKKKLDVCVLLAKEMGVLNEYYHNRACSMDTFNFEEVLEKGKALLGEETELGLDRTFNTCDYDLLLVMKKDNAYDLIPGKIKSMAKEIHDSYFDYLLAADEEAKKK